jgi:hypothetical protein
MTQSIHPAWIRKFVSAWKQKFVSIQGTQLIEKGIPISGDGHQCTVKNLAQEYDGYHSTHCKINEQMFQIAALQIQDERRSSRIKFSTSFGDLILI